jgi:hypothetical protein
MRVLMPCCSTLVSERLESAFDSELARPFNPDCFAKLSRMRGFVLRKR